ncbi:MAG: L-arabinose transport system permease protein AraQ [Rhodospirillaceae bacterium]|nr:MAG: L-arabinose transport system permease protein AraQ [Rhodospirillaceae bacterium]
MANNEDAYRFEAGDLLRYAILGLAGFLSLVPFVYMLLLSGMSQYEAINASTWWPETFLIFENLETAWAYGRFWLYAINTVVVTLFSTLGQVVFCALAGYAFAAISFRGKRLSFLLLLITLMVPEAVLITPTFTVIKGQIFGISVLNIMTLMLIATAVTLLLYALLSVVATLTARQILIWPLTFAGLLAFMGMLTIAGVVNADFGTVLADELWPPKTLLNTYQVMILPIIGNAYSIFLFRQFFIQLPDELWQAAKLDGANHLQYFVRVVVPLSVPAFSTIGVLAFIWSWNSYAWPILTQTGADPKYTLSVGLRELSNDYISHIPAQMAGALIVVLPVLIAYSIAVRQFTDSLARVGIK